MMNYRHTYKGMHHRESENWKENAADEPTVKFHEMVIVTV